MRPVEAIKGEEELTFALHTSQNSRSEGAAALERRRGQSMRGGDYGNSVIVAIERWRDEASKLFVPTFNSSVACCARTTE